MTAQSPGHPPLPNDPDAPARRPDALAPAHGGLDMAAGPADRIERCPAPDSVVSEPGLGARNNVFFAAIEMTRMPMVLTDPRQPDNPIVFCNRAFLDLLRAREEDVLGRNCRFLQGPDTDPAAVREIREAVAAERAVAVELLNYRPDGTPFWNALFLGPVFDADGRILYWFASQLDVTARRTSQESLLQAQKFEAIGQLTAGVAHDFNNLLHVIVGNLHIARRLTADAPPVQAALERAANAALRGGRLTQQLLSFARKQRLDPRELNLNTLVVEMGELLVRTVGEDLELRLDLGLGLPDCVVDAAQLEMALLNLLRNARDAMPHGGRVTLGTSVAERDYGDGLRTGQAVVLWVRDEGAGMPPDVLRRATEPFFTTKALGTGLGLAMVQGFVAQSHGRLDVSSEVGRGTTVRLVFPLAPPHAQRPAPPSRRALPAAPVEAAADGEPPVVWVIEDDEDVRSLTESVVAELGCEAVVAASGDQALDLLEHERSPQVVISDVMMPGSVNGVELAERLTERHPQAQVILMTGYTDLAGNAPCPGRYRVLTKPFELDELKSALSGALAPDTPRAPALTP